MIQPTVSGVGNVQPATDVQANFQTAGTLSNVSVKLGQHVQAGQLLAYARPTADEHPAARPAERPADRGGRKRNRLWE